MEGQPVSFHYWAVDDGRFIGKYKWASKISGAIITLVIALVLVNIHVIPDSAPVFDDIVWGYAVEMSFLMQ